ncbi:MAG: HlyD family efflux transporter periplasmic adaptor subunit [Actinomycetota bacterium]|nr:HlyD family efflux transporter periplasmic adaptor subunit [Actinomycetota bacterium]
MEGPVAAPPAQTDQAAADSAPAVPPPRRKLKRSTRIGLIIILILALVAAGGFGTSYFLNARNYVSTDNAQVDGSKISINAPTTGTLTDWRISQGSVVHEGEVVGRVKIPDGFAQPLMSIKAPADGTVAVDNGVPGTFVTTGTPLAVAYDMNNIYVTARVDETDIQAVHVGAPVDIDVDAYSNTPLTGHVREIQGGAAAVFSLFPQSNSGGNFQKVTQVIPVKIGFDNVDNLNLVPGMNVTVHIHKQPATGR